MTEYTPEVLCDGDIRLYHGDCIDVMRGLPDCSVDSVVTDPPYGIDFVDAAWDGDTIRAEHGTFQSWTATWAGECLRVLKPGGHLLAFGSPRQWHRLAAGIEDAGFDIRDSIAWLHVQGWPKRLDISYAIDRGQTLSREQILRFTTWLRSTGITAAQINQATGTQMSSHYLSIKSQPAVPRAKDFDLLRPLLPEVPAEIEELVAQQTGTAREDRETAYIGRPTELLGGWKTRDAGTPVLDAAKQWEGWGTALKPAFEPVVVARKPLESTVAASVTTYGTGALNIKGCETEAGAYPPNVTCDQAAAEQITAESNIQVADHWPVWRLHTKASPDERPRANGVAHPTVKPVGLMAWLVRLVTPPHGLVLEPFAGSGTTGETALAEGMRAILIEREADYLPLIRQRLGRPIDTVLPLGGAA